MKFGEGEASIWEESGKDLIISQRISYNTTDIDLRRIIKKPQYKVGVGRFFINV